MGLLERIDRYKVAIDKLRLERAHRDDKPFIEFIAERVLESEKDMMRLLHIPRPDAE